MTHGPHMRDDGSHGKDQPDHGDQMYDALANGKQGGWLRYDRRWGWRLVPANELELHRLGVELLEDTIHGGHGPDHQLPVHLRSNPEG
jgi:hypothetical protein